MKSTWIMMLWIVAVVILQGISMCTKAEISGKLVYVDFKQVPKLSELSCKCTLTTNITSQVSFSHYPEDKDLPEGVSIQFDGESIKNASSKAHTLTDKGTKVLSLVQDDDTSAPEICMYMAAVKEGSSLTLTCEPADTPTNGAKVAFTSVGFVMALLSCVVTAVSVL